MAGGTLKAFGGIFLALGIVLFVVGLVAAGFAAYDAEQNHNGNFPSRDRDEADSNVILAGGISAGVGLVLGIIGVVLLATGSGRANQAIVRAARGDPERELAVAATAPEPGAGQPDGTRVPTASTRRPATPTWKVLTIGLGCLILLFLLAAVLLGGRIPGTPYLRNGEASVALGHESQDGKVSSGPTIAGVSTLAGDGTQPAAFTAASGTTRIEGVVTWTPGAGCCQVLQVTLEQKVGTGWEPLLSSTGGPGLAFNVTVDPAKGLDFHYLVFPGEDGVSAGQPYHIDVTEWG